MPVLIFSCVRTFAQEDSTRKTHFKFGVYYNSNLNYYGRTDSLGSHAFFPLAEIWFNSNFYLNAAPIFVGNSRSSMSYAGSVATAGYQKLSAGKKWLQNLYVVKPFYKPNSGIVQSALKAQGAFSLSNLNKVINITGSLDIKLSDQVDFGASGGLDHIFRKQFAGGALIVVDPSACVFAGTQRFSVSSQKQNNFLIFPETEQSVSENEKKISVLSYEFSMPVIFSKGKFQLLIIPAYVIPMNVIAITGQPDLSEPARKLFYATIGGKISI